MTYRISSVYLIQPFLDLLKLPLFHFHVCSDGFGGKNDFERLEMFANASRRFFIAGSSRTERVSDNLYTKVTRIETQGGVAGGITRPPNPFSQIP